MLEKKIIMMVGLPRSGKSTIAKKISKAEGWPIVNPDSIRLAIYGQRYWKDGEDLVWAHVGIMISALFSAGHDVIILDGTNIISNLRDKFFKYADKIEYAIIATTPENCKHRAVIDDMEDLIPIIDSMAQKMELPSGTYFPLRQYDCWIQYD